MSNKHKAKGPKSQIDNLAEKYLVNEDIKAKEVFIIGSDGEKKGIFPKQRALEMAVEEGLDLVQVGMNDAQVITKIMDFGKFLYAKKKQMADAKKHQKVLQVKEIKIRPNIGDQDYNTKMKQAANFLKTGKKVKFTLQFRGRQMLVKSELGQQMFDRITGYLKEQGFDNLIEEKDQKIGPYWTKIYFVK
ncbi:MAG: translation initiation factor IF-3 [bacterium]